MTTLDSLYSSDNFLFSYKIQISDDGVETVSKIKLQNYYEVILRTELDQESEVYVDNSMSLQKREFIDHESAIKLNLTYPDPDEQISKIRVNGLNGYPNVDGSYFKMDKNWYGFATS